MFQVAHNSLNRRRCLRLLLFKTFGAFYASDCEVDFFGLCVVLVPEKFVDTPQTGKPPSDRGVAVVHCHCLNVFACTG